jgi:uncharacterized protein (TIGR02118 family)
MVKVSVLYGPPEDPAAFDDYYANTHVPLAAKMPNVARFEASKVVNDAPYYRIAELWFANQEDLQAAMGSEEGQATTADIPKFATGGATVVISQLD